MSKTRLERRSASGRRFWEISRKGKKLHIAYGLVGGRTPRHHVVELTSTAVARAERERRLEQKLSEGFRRTDEPEPERPPPRPVERELIDQIQRGAAAGAAGAVEPLSVLSDQLASRGDPQGELIALALSEKADSPRAEALRRETLERACGPDAVELLRPRWHIKWRGGFLGEANIDVGECHRFAADAVELCEKLFDHPAGALLESLSLAAGNYRRPRGRSREKRPSHQAVFDQLLELVRRKAPPTLRHLAIHRASDRVVSIDSEALNATLSAAGIDALTLSGNGRGSPVVDLSLLREIRLEGAAHHIESIHYGSPESLERLVFDFDWIYQEDSLHWTMENLLTPETVPRLRRLGLLCNESANFFCQRMLGSGLLAQLEELDLWLPGLDEESQSALVGQRKALAHLRLAPSYLEAESPFEAYNMSQLLDDMGRREDALRLVEASLADPELHRPYFEHFQRGLLLSRLGRHEESMASYRRSIELCPDFIVAVNNLAYAEYRHGDRDRALELYERALALGREQVSSEHEDYGTDHAEDILVTALQWHGRVVAEREGPEAEAARESLDEAERRLRERMERGVVNTNDGRFEIAWIDSVRGEHERALEALRALCAGDPGFHARIRKELSPELLERDPRYAELAD